MNNVNNEIKEQLFQKNKNIEDNQSNIKNYNKMECINNNIINIKKKDILAQKRKITIERQQKFKKVNIFLNNRWDLKDEYINLDKYNFNFKQINNQNNIINDINSLSNKRASFINNISKISNLKHI